MYSKKRVSILVMLLIVSVMLVGFVSAGWFSDLFKFGEDEGLEGELAEQATASVRVTESLVPPDVTFVQQLPTQTLNDACGSQQIMFNFLATQAGTNANLPGTIVGQDITLFVQGNITHNTLPGEAVRTLQNCKFLNTIGSTHKNYSCNITAQYFDTSSGTWRIRVQMKTVAAPFGPVNDSISFSYAPLRLIRFPPGTPNYVNWTNVAPTDVNRESDNDLTIENCGNENIDGTIYYVRINATKLTSATTSDTISAGNFTGREGATVCLTPYNFTEANWRQLTFDLTKSAGAPSTSTLRFCLHQLGWVQANQNLSTPMPWVIDNYHI